MFVEISNYFSSWGNGYIVRMDKSSFMRVNLVRILADSRSDCSRNA
ncbi:hypothetical protein CFter6_2886 [Collimonas fungivorans]|uniref:Uncharacterized protein n=1 Tax=Collimonas fungivorans TaxID=158899 RepID=A0A127PCM2_9BURK|nr:hypothetical protein CFter6_2886 [Collimonas fungivorans]